MSDDDSPATEATKQPAATSSAATAKYQQIVVPDHALKPDTSGTSFLRTGTFPSLTDATKQPPGFQKSLALARLAGDHHLKTGGSWHHVDGNRIETTTGRKVEVIRGSYIAHRGPGNSPGPAFTVAWPSHSYTQTGSEDLPVGWEPTTNAQGEVIVNAQGEETGAVQPSPATNDPSSWASALSRHYKESYDPSPGVTPGQTPATEQKDAPSINNGDVITTTWAQRILTYVGSITRPVPLVYAETRAGANHSYSYYSVESLTYVGSDGEHVPKVVAETHAGSIESKSWAHEGDITTWNHANGGAWQDTVALAILTTQEAKADISVFNTAPNLSTVNIGAAQETINIGGIIGTINIAGGIGAFNIGPQLVINVPESVQFTLSDGKIVLAGAEMTAVHTSIKNAFTVMSMMQNVTNVVINELSASNTSIAETRFATGQILNMMIAQSMIGF